MGGTPKRRDVALVLTAAVLFVVGGWLFVVDYGASEAHSPDGGQYLRMARGETVDEPYASRVLAPRLAGAITDDPETGFRVVTLTAFVIALSVAALLAVRLGVATWAAILAMVLAGASPAAFYNLANPFLTDAPALSGLTVATAAFVLDAWPLFVVAIAAATAFREAAASSAALWLPVQRIGRAVTASLIAVGVLLVARPFVESTGHFGRTGMPAFAIWLRDLIRSWGPLWIAAPIGLWHLRTHRTRVAAAAAVLLAIGLVLTFVFNDTERMVLPLLAIMVVGTARLIDVARSRLGLLFLIVPVLITPALAFRNDLLDESSLLRTSEALRISVVGIGCAGALALARVAGRVPSTPAH